MPLLSVPTHHHQVSRLSGIFAVFPLLFLSSRLFLTSLKPAKSLLHALTYQRSTNYLFMPFKSDSKGGSGGGGCCSLFPASPRHPKSLRTASVRTKLRSKLTQKVETLTTSNWCVHSGFHWQKNICDIHCQLKILHNYFHNNAFNSFRNPPSVLLLFLSTARWQQSKGILTDNNKAHSKQRSLLHQWDWQN